MKRPELTRAASLFRDRREARARLRDPLARLDPGWAAKLTPNVLDQLLEHRRKLAELTGMAGRAGPALARTSDDREPAPVIPIDRGRKR